MNDPQPEGHMASHIERRKFLATLGGAAAGWPLAVRAQQSGERVRRVGILMPYPQTEQETQARVRAFKEELHRLGWGEGSKNEVDQRGATDNMELARPKAASPVRSKPESNAALRGHPTPLP